MLLQETGRPVPHENYCNVVEYDASGIRYSVTSYEFWVTWLKAQDATLEAD
jgi:hypothetical protein